MYLPGPCTIASPIPWFHLARCASCPFCEQVFFCPGVGAIMTFMPYEKLHLNHWWNRTEIAEATLIKQIILKHMRAASSWYLLWDPETVYQGLKALNDL